MADPQQVIAQLQRQLAICVAERDEALAQQAATAEVLQVINASPGDLAPVFDAMLEKGVRLSEADFGVLCTLEGEHLRPAAMHGVPPVYAEFLHRNPLNFAPGSGPAQVLAGLPYHTVADFAADELTQSGDPHRRALVDLGRARTGLAVPLRKDGALIGLILAMRQQVKPFTDKQIALLQSFAAQAVIAMENARLITETREALEQQTATAEVLQVINSSPGDLAPVFDAILEKAHSLCGIAQGSLELYDGELFRAVACRGLSDDFADMLRQGYPASDNPATRPLIQGRRFTYISDLAETDYAITRSSAELVGVRTLLCVPLRREGQLLGMIASARKEVRPFSEKDIALLENFAAQAVIAMENARLLTETREALEQQTATAEVLAVINASPGDLAPVFEAMLEKAHQLCGVDIGNFCTFDGEFFRAVAIRGLPTELAELMHKPYRGNALHHRLVTGERYVHVPDTHAVAAQMTDPAGRTLAEQSQVRSFVMVPLRKEGVLLGHIAAAREELHPFTDKQIALLQNFAAQAVIAMENARLLGELRERTSDLEESLEYQTATSDVLQVISRSTFDLQPVLDTLVETAARLCGADNGSVATRDGKDYRVVAQFALASEWVDFVRTLSFRPGSDNVTARTLLTREIVQVADITTDPGYKLGEAATKGNLRTVLGVPLLREGEPVGVMQLSRTRIEPFTERQIELVRTFADQAVIAIENTRLLTELRESLEQQQAMAELLQVINSSQGELQPVFDKILEKAHTVCGVAMGTLELYDGEIFRAVAMVGISGDFADLLRRGYPASEGEDSRVLVEGARYSHIADQAALNLPVNRSAVALADHRTLLSIPLRREGQLLGMIASARTEVKPFSDSEIALLEGFAGQAVIAMDNARLLDEIRQRQAELRVTFDNMGDGVAMFDAGMRLVAWNRNFQQLLDLPDALLAERPSFQEYFDYLAARGEYGSADLEAELRRNIADMAYDGRFERTRPDGRVIEVRRNAVPGGGAVLIYGDVTERKRAEAEIRAARDVAEAALRDLQAAQANLIQAEKMASLGQLTAGIAHEIKNPLNFVNNFAGLSIELLAELKEAAAPAFATLDTDARAEIDETVVLLTGNLEKIGEHGRRADNIVKSMLEHSRGVSGERRQVDLNNLIEEALNLAYHGARAQDQSFNIALEREFDPALAPIELAPQEMTRVFLNLIGNGFYAATKRQRDGGEPSFRPTLSVTTREDGEAIEVRIRDNGTGIPQGIRDKLFQPFFTTKPTGEGTGLGLSISYDIVTQQHGGTITVDSEPGAFTEFTVCLPRARRATAEAA